MRHGHECRCNSITNRRNPCGQDPVSAHVQEEGGLSKAGRGKSSQRQCNSRDGLWPKTEGRQEKRGEEEGGTRYTRHTSTPFGGVTGVTGVPWVPWVP